MTTADEADKKARLERARETGLFRYSLVQELLEPGLSLAERGWRAREMAARVHEGPGGRRVTVSYSTLTRWRRAYEEGGFDALVPAPRQSQPRTPPEVLALAAALKKENPARTAAQVQRILQGAVGVGAHGSRTIQRMFHRTGADHAGHACGRTPVSAGSRAGRPNEIWTGDALHWPYPGGRPQDLPVRLPGRPFPGGDGRPVRVRPSRTPSGWPPRSALDVLGTRGVPEHVYVDNGSAFVDAWLLRACAVLGIKLVHSQGGAAPP